MPTVSALMNIFVGKNKAIPCNNMTNAMKLNLSVGCGDTYVTEWGSKILDDFQAGFIAIGRSTPLLSLYGSVLSSKLPYNAFISIIVFNDRNQYKKVCFTELSLKHFQVFLYLKFEFYAKLTKFHNFTEVS